MKKSVYLFLVVLSLIMVNSCDKNTATIDLEQPAVAKIEAGYRTVNDAIAIAEKATSMLTAESVTRSNIRRVDISNIGMLMSDNSTRAEALDADTLMYIVNFEDNQGFALVPKNEKAPELLAIADSGSYNGEDTDNVGFNMYVDYVLSDLERLNNVQPNGQVIVPITEWELLELSDTTFVAPKLRTKWHQNSPFNKNCFVFGLPSGTSCPAGCVAIAMAQIMAYHRYPETINITHRNNQAPIPLMWDVWEENYNYDTIRLPMFIREIGALVDMQYAPNNSSSQTARAIAAFSSLGYNVGSYTQFGRDVILLSLDDDCPLMIRGTHNVYNAGHSWVTDGYMVIDKTSIYRTREQGAIDWDEHYRESETKTYLHFNWGYENGRENGYYLFHIKRIDQNGDVTSGYSSQYKANELTDFLVNFNNNICVIPFIKPNN